MTPPGNKEGSGGTGRISRPPTIGDVAQKAGVSRSAVSRAHTPGAYVSKATRAKIEAAERELGYRPNLVARSLSISRSSVVAVAITRLENSFHAEALASMTLRLKELGYRVLLFLTDPALDEDPPIDDVLRHRVEAIVLFALRFSSDFARECRRAGVPVILVNRIAEAGGVSAVVGDNWRGGRTIAHFLLAGGHQRFAYLAGLEEASTSRDREGGFREGLFEGGVLAPVREFGRYTSNGAAAACRALLSAREAPDAIFCANDHMAMAAMDVARREFGRDVGRDLSIVGFDNSAPAANAGIELTSYTQSASEMADAAVEILAEVIGAPRQTPRRVVIAGDLVVRKSARVPSLGLIRKDGVVIWRGG